MENENFVDIGLVDPNDTSLFEGIEDPNEEKEKEEKKETQENNQETEEKHTAENQEGSESVGNEENNSTESKESANSESGSPNNNYSSIAMALNEAEILRSINEDEIKSIKTPEDFLKVMSKEVDSRLDEEQRNLKEALNAGISVDYYQAYTNAMKNLEKYTPEVIADERNQSAREQVLMQYYKAKGLDDTKAKRMVTSIVESGEDIKETSEAIEAFKSYYTQIYNNEVDRQRQIQENTQKQLQEQDAKLKKSIVEDGEFFKDLVIDKKQRQAVYDSISRARNKVGDGYLTDIEKYQRENPVDFLKYMGLFYTMTDGFTDISKLIKGPVKKEKNKAVQRLEQVINNTTRNMDGSLNLASGVGPDNADIFDIDNWKLAD